MPGSGERHVPSFCSVKKAIMCPWTPDSSDHSRLHGGRLLSEEGEGLSGTKREETKTRFTVSLSP